jgi:hypothetical protein
MFSKKERFFSREKLLQNDKDVLLFRKRSCFALMRNLFFQRGTLMFSKKERFFSREKLLQNDRGVLSFRQKTILSLMRNLFLSARDFNVFEKGKILQSQKAPSE